MSYVLTTLSLRRTPCIDQTLPQEIQNGRVLLAFYLDRLSILNNLMFSPL